MRPDDNSLRWDIVGFFHGNILDISEGRGKCFPHFISYMDARISDPQKLSVFSDASFDGIFSSNLLHLLPLGDIPSVMAEWSRVVKQGGHIMLHLPDTETNAQKWLPSYDSVVAFMDKLERGWDLVAYSERPDSGLLFVFKLSDRRMRSYSYHVPKPEKSCAITRLGAFGDNIQASSILPWLKEQGYHITFYCSDHGVDVIKHDPHIDRFIIQGKDEVPPQFLGEFWKYESKKYHKWINLSESVEATLLAAPGHTNHEWPNSVRAKYMDINYTEFTHDIAEVPPPYRPKFYSTIEERAWAKDKARSYGKRNILWSLSGSSVHKTWPHLDAIVARVMLEYDDVHIVMVGDELCQLLEAGWGRERRVHCQSGKWSIRESMAFAEVADLVIGCETGLLNAAGSMDTPKIVTLSHSSFKMLCQHWKNVIALEQPKGMGCHKFPCRQLHTSGWDDCMKHEETGTAVCQNEITVEQMWDAVSSVLGKSMKMVA